MSNSAFPPVTETGVQTPVTASLSANTVPERRYSTDLSPLPVSPAVTVTVCVFLKNIPKVTLFMKELNRFVPITISAAGGVMSATPSTVTVMSPLTPVIINTS